MVSSPKITGSTQLLSGIQRWPRCPDRPSRNLVTNRGQHRNVVDYANQPYYPRR